MKLRAHVNVIDLAEARRERERPVRMVFPGFATVRSTSEKEPPSFREAFVRLLRRSGADEEKA